MAVLIGEYVLGGEKRQVYSKELWEIIDSVAETTGQSIVFPTFKAVQCQLKEHGEVFLKTDENIEVHIFDLFILQYKDIELEQLFQ